MHGWTRRVVLGVFVTSLAACTLTTSVDGLADGERAGTEAEDARRDDGDAPAREDAAHVVPVGPVDAAHEGGDASDAARSLPTGTCAGGCSCAGSTPCSRTCVGQGCAFTCSGSGDCTFVCPGGGCTAVGGGSGDVELDCSGDGCTMTCSGSGGCGLTGCSKDCHATCTGSGSCANTCAAPSCG